jgi:hypothetical protein
MFIIICSFDNILSYENIDLWLNHINNTSKILNKNLVNLIPIVILVNKNDLKNTEKKFKFSDINQNIKNKNFNIIAYPFSAKDLSYKEIYEKIEFLLYENPEKNNSYNYNYNYNGDFNFNTITPKSISQNNSNKSSIERDKDINKSKSFKISRNSEDSKFEKKSSGSCCINL